MKTCNKCFQEKALDDFPVHRKGVKHYSCKACSSAYFRDYRKRKPEMFYQNKRRDQLKRFKMTPEMYDEMFATQGGVCAICATPPPESGWSLAVDHDHACCPGPKTCGKCVRGLLCTACNTALGIVEDTMRLTGLVAYANQHGR